MKVNPKERWYTGITRYQWLVLVICLVGWMFDIFEGQIFVAVMPEAMPSFLTETDPVLREKQAEFFNQVALVSFLLGGTLGGVVFGMLSDRIGRKQTMAWSIIFYSVFTWLTAFSMVWWHLAVLRFFVAIGVGGQWAVASAFVAETFPSKARAHAASLFHAFGSFGTLLAAFVGAMMLGNVAVLTWAETTPLLEWARNIYEPSTLPWRLCFALGLIPSIVVFFIFAYLKEPEKWQAAQEAAKKDPTKRVGSIADLFQRDTIRSTIIGVTLAAIGMATFWGVHIRGKDTIRLVAQNQMVDGRLVALGVEIVTTTTEIVVGEDGEERTIIRVVAETEPGGGERAVTRDPRYITRTESDGEGGERQRSISGIAIAIEIGPPGEGGRVVSLDEASEARRVISLDETETVDGVEGPVTWGVFDADGQAVTAVVTEIVDGQERDVTRLVAEVGSEGEVTAVFRNTERRAFAREQFAELKRWEMLGMVIATLGLLFGQLSFGPLSNRIGRRGAFVFFHIGAFFIAIFVFQVTQYLDSVVPLYFLLPIFGFFTAGMHSGYAVYFPELFPSRLRGTGVGFCFNMGRLTASPILLGLGLMVSMLGISLMTAFTILSFLYLLGPIAVLYARETRGQELME